MRVQDCMTKGAHIIAPTTTLQDAARQMKAENFGAIPVGENDRLIGMVTDRDIVVHGVAENRPGGSTTVREVMSSGIHYVYEDDEIDQAAKLMNEHQIHRLPVLNRDKRLVGMLARADLGPSHGGASAEALKGISKPGRA